MDSAQQVTSEIYASVKSDAKIAAAVGCSQPTIWRIRTGKVGDCQATLYQSLVRYRDELLVETAPS